MSLIPNNVKQWVRSVVSSRVFLGDWSCVKFEELKKFINEVEIPKDYRNIIVQFEEVLGDNISESGYTVRIIGKRLETNSECVTRKVNEKGYLDNKRKQDRDYAEQIIKDQGGRVVFED